MLLFSPTHAAIACYSCSLQLLLDTRCVAAAATAYGAYVHTAVLGVDGLGQVCAILAEPAATDNLVAEIQQIKGLIHAVCVKRVSPEFLQAQG